MIFIENNLVLKNKCYKNIKDEDSIRNINEISDEMQIITKLTENNDELTIKISEYSEQVKLLTETIARNKLQQQKQLQIIVRNIKYSNNLEKEDMNRVLEKTIEKQQPLSAPGCWHHFLSTSILLFLRQEGRHHLSTCLLGRSCRSPRP